MIVINSQTDIDYYKDRINREKNLAIDIIEGKQLDYNGGSTPFKNDAKTVKHLCELMEAIIDFFECGNGQY